jgi:hypothetical protein
VERLERRHELLAIHPDVGGRNAIANERRGLAVLVDERALLREALAGLRTDDSPLRTQLLVRLAMAEAVARRPRSECERLCREASAMARRLGDGELLASTLDASHHILWEHGDVDQQIGTAREILRHAQAANVPDLEIEARQWLVRDHLERADVVAAEREMQRHARLAEELRTPRYLWHAAHWRATSAHLAGRLGEAEVLLRAALDVGRRTDPDSARAHYVAGLFLLRRDQGRLDELLDPARRLVRRGPLPWEARAGLALLYAEVERRSEAQAELACLTPSEIEGMPYGSGRLAALCALADASTHLGDVRTAGTLYETLLPHAGRNLIIGDAAIFHGCVSRHLGRLASILGRGADAEMHLRRALAMHVRLRALPLQARTRLDLGTALLVRNGDGDWARATAHLGEARILAGALGMRAVVRQSMRLLASLRPRRTRGAETAASSSLLEEATS